MQAWPAWPPRSEGLRSDTSFTLAKVTAHLSARMPQENEKALTRRVRVRGSCLGGPAPELALPLVQDPRDPVLRRGVRRQLRAGQGRTRRLPHLADDAGHPEARSREGEVELHFVSEGLKGAVKEATIRPEVTGSDHCPVGVDLDGVSP